MEDKIEFNYSLLVKVSDEPKKKKPYTRRLSYHEKEEVVRLLKEGYSIKSIAAASGVANYEMVQRLHLELKKNDPDYVYGG